MLSILRNFGTNALYGFKKILYSLHWCLQRGSEDLCGWKFVRSKTVN